MKPLLGALAMMLVAACHDSTGIGQDLGNAKARWDQSGIAKYTFTVKISCFCGTIAPIRVTVVNDVPTSVVFADSTAVAADTTQYRSYLTIDRIFTVIQGSLDQNPSKFVASYDGATGYPKTVTIDPKATVADDELGIQVMSLTPNP